MPNATEIFERLKAEAAVDEKQRLATMKARETITKLERMELNYAADRERSREP